VGRIKIQFNRYHFGEAEGMAQDQKQTRWTAVLGAIIARVILGAVYAFSVFVKPLEMEFFGSRATTQWAFSFTLVTFVLTMIPAGACRTASARAPWLL
jgi:uncharacterized membrane protein